MPNTTKIRRVAIIGGGPAGICTAKNLLKDKHEPIVFERFSTIGGIWAYDESRPGGAYSTTLYQTTKYISSFSDFPFKETAAVFPSHQEILEYLNEYVNHFELKKYFRFNTVVTNLKRVNDKWQLTATGEHAGVYEFDAIALCTGQYWHPRIPALKGQERFTGKVIHSSVYKENSVFENQRVIVVGSGVSGMDIAVEASKIATQTSWCVREKNWIKPRWFGFIPYEAGVTEGIHLSKDKMLESWKKWIPDFMNAYEESGLIPERDPFIEGFCANDEILFSIQRKEIDLKPPIAELTTNGCIFTDGTEMIADTIVLATGYEEMNFPFFDENILEKLGLHEEGLDLYHHIFHPELPDFAFVFHVTGNAPAMPVIDLQSRWISKVWSGEHALPSKEKMQEWINTDTSIKQKSLNKKRYRSNFIDGSYLQTLGELIGLFPNKTTHWKEYLEMIAPPSFPMIYRLHGSNPWEGAKAAIELARKKYPLKSAHLGSLKFQVLEKCTPAQLLTMYKNQQIDKAELTQVLSLIKKLDKEKSNSILTTPDTIDLKKIEEKSFVEGYSYKETHAIGKQTEVKHTAADVEEELVRIVAELLKLDVHEIDVEEDMSGYGFDSISLGNFSRIIKEKYRLELSPSVLFEYTTIRSFSDYLKKQGVEINTAVKEKSFAENITPAPIASQPLMEHSRTHAFNGTDAHTTTPVQGTSRDIEEALLKMVAGLLKLEVDEIDVEEDMSGYGFDSISLGNFSRLIKEVYKIELSPSVLFEYTTIRSFSTYLFEQGVSVKIAKTVNNETIKTDVQPVVEDPTKFPEWQHEEIKNTHNKKEDLAIIGWHARLPQCSEKNELWELLVAGKSSVIEIPEDRFDWRINVSDNKKQLAMKWGSFIDSPEKFDATFFNISPREAELMDPQQRIVLESVWSCIEDAGYRVSEINQQPVGIFVGASSQDYKEMIETHELEEVYSVTGLNPAIIANRISYLLNFRGPSETVNTACSSTLVALNRAVTAIQGRECNVAVVSGVNLLLSPKTFIALSKTEMLSKQGQCKSFASDADGYVRAEGVGSFMIKSLSNAIADGDTVYAVIKGIGVNHNGRSNSMSAPNPKSQTELISQVIKNSGIDPNTLSYIEGQGTGNVLSDEIEFNAALNALENLGVNKPKTCAIGSVKSNIGNLEAASGVASLAKVILSMNNEVLIPTLCSKHDNRNIVKENKPLYLLQDTQKWERLTMNGKIIPLRCGISAFAVGGSNAYVLLEEYRGTANQTIPDKEQLIIISAKTKESLLSYKKELARFLKTTNVNFAELAYTLQVGREEMEWRFAVISPGKNELIQQLEEGETQIYDGKPVSGRLTRTINDQPELVKFVSEILHKRDLKTIAKLWVEGVQIPWKTLYDQIKIKRISLPTYRFTPEKHWALKDKIKQIDTHLVSEPQVNSFNNGIGVLEDELLEIIRSKIKNKLLKAEESLNDYGIDSIGILNIKGIIEDKFATEIPASVLFSLSTIRNISAYIEKNKMEELKNNAYLYFTDEKTDNATEEVSLIPINSNGKDVPLFLVHPIGGSVYCYSRLSKMMGKDKNVYAFQSVGLDSDINPPDNVRIMAAKYIREMKGIQPHGPYRLGGWSFGGVVAYEMTQQLEAQGEKVWQLFLLDSYFCKQQFNYHESDDIALFAYLLKDIAMQMGKENILTQTSMEDMFREAITNELFSSEVSFDLIQRIFKVFKYNCIAYEQYKPKRKIQTEAWSFVAADHSYIGSAEEADIWKELINGKLHMHEVSGNHFTILTEKGLEHIAETINNVIYENA